MVFNLLFEHQAQVSRPLPKLLVILGLRLHRHDQAVEVEASIRKTAIVFSYHNARIV